MWEKILVSVIGAVALSTIKGWLSGATWKAFASKAWKGITGMFTTIRAWLTIAALVASFGAGCFVTYKFTSVEKLEAENAQFRKDVERMKVALQLNDKIDADNDGIEKSNQEIIDALVEAKHKADAPPEIKTVEVPQSCPSSKPHPVCLTAAGMRRLGKLR